MSRGGDGIEARFQSLCPRCGEDILPGHRVVLQRGRYLHVGCASGGDES